MADTSKISPDGGSTIYDIKDKTARTQITNAYKVMGEMGAKNLIDISRRSFPVTSRNATITFNGEYMILNGSQYNSDRTYLQLTPDFFHSDLLPEKLEIGKQYTLTMEGSKSSQTTGLNYEATLWSSASSTVANTSDNNKLTFEYTEALANNNQVQLQVILSSGTGTYETDTPLKLILRHAEDTDDTYAQYAMTNIQLTYDKPFLFHQAYDVSTTLNNMIIALITEYRADKRLYSGKTITVAAAINTVDYYIVNMTQDNNRVMGYVITTGLNFYAFHYNLDNQTFNIKQATMTNV